MGVQSMTTEEQLEEIYETLVGDDGQERYTHEELIDYINQLLHHSEVLHMM